jgi:hypothetical protein
LFYLRERRECICLASDSIDTEESGRVLFRHGNAGKTSSQVKEQRG